MCETIRDTRLLIEVINPQTSHTDNRFSCRHLLWEQHRWEEEAELYWMVLMGGVKKQKKKLQGWQIRHALQIVNEEEKHRSLRCTDNGSSMEKVIYKRSNINCMSCFWFCLFFMQACVYFRSEQANLFSCNFVKALNKLCMHEKCPFLGDTLEVNWLHPQDR